MSQLRNLGFPNKGRLANLNLLVQQQADLGKHTLAKKLIEAYKLAKTLYLPFKRKCHYDLATFIEAMQDFGDQIRQYGQAHPARTANPQPKNIFVLPEAIRRLIKAYGREGRP